MAVTVAWVANWKFMDSVSRVCLGAAEEGQKLQYSAKGEIRQTMREQMCCNFMGGRGETTGLGGRSVERNEYVEVV